MDVELTDTQIALMIKAALEFNATVISNASFVYGQQFKPHTRKAFVKQFHTQCKEYQKQLERIIDGETK